MSESIYQSEHRIFRESFRKFVTKEIEPRLVEWEANGIVPREVWRRLGSLDYLCTGTADKYGGAGADFRYAVIITEELARVNSTGLQPYVHSDIAVPYIEQYGSEELKQKYLPRCVSGDMITGIAMTEPDAGSDAAAIRTSAAQDGEYYIINGNKIFISNGVNGDLFVTAVKTDPDADPPYKGISLILIPSDSQGFSRGEKYKKMGTYAQDTAELIFSDCKVHRSHLLGQEGLGFKYLMRNLQQERLIASIDVQTRAEAMLNLTIDHCKNRMIFGQPLSKFQNTQFKIVEMATEIQLGRQFLDRLIPDHIAGREVTREVSMAKWWIPEMANRVAYQCQQLHGGYGYMEDYPICRFARDIRVTSIAAGTTETMKTIVAKMIGL